jgi:hypothetical protein
MATTTFALAVDKLVRDRDTAFLQKIAEDYTLPYEELQAKYLAVAEAAVKVKRTYKKREPKMVEITNEDGDKVQVPVKSDSKEKKTCEAQTSKKEACKFSSLKGGCFCKRHQRQHDEEKSGEPVLKKAKKEVVKKQEQPLHNHSLDTVATDCNLCSSHGNPLTNTSEDFELVMPTQTADLPNTQALRLAAMLEEEDSESEYEEGDEPEVKGSDDESIGSEYEDEE